jgi:hypothetical protein
MQITFKWPWEKTEPVVRKPPVPAPLPTPVYWNAWGEASKISTPISASAPKPALVTQEIQMASFKSILESIGADVKKVFAFVASPQAQAVIAAGEGVAETAFPQITGVVNLANNYIVEALKTEALAAGAAQQNGSGVQKLAAVVTAVTPQALAYAQASGLPAPTSAQIQTQANSIVAFLNAIASV